MRFGEIVTIRSSSGEALLSYRSFASIVGIVALVVSVIVAVTGLAAVLFLMFDGRVFPAVMAFLLSAAFVVVIAMLVPTTHVSLFEGSHPVLQIAQQSNVSLPIVTYTIGTPEQKVIGRLRKSVWSRLGRNRWDILTTNGDRPIGYAAEESLSRALVRKVAGKFSSRYQSNIRINYLGKSAGWIIRRPDINGDADVLEIAGEMDRRLAVALATLILGSEP
ncbi:MAG TPA: hypothetical protein VER58_14470 [Thermoanaerobaculia bacterium]|nr:hypothetical protein [Thermoanaerobaculia bacterium]